MIKLLIIMAPGCLVAGSPWSSVCMFSVSSEWWGNYWGGGWAWGGGGVSRGVREGGRAARVCREDALDTKVSSVAASTTSLGRQFQSLIVLGRKEELLSCVLAGMSLNCLS